MNKFKSYFAPGHKKDDGGKKIENAAEDSTISEKIPEIVSPNASRPASLYPEGDFRNQNKQSLLDIKSDVMVNWLHQSQLEKLWAHELPGEGVVLKKGKGDYCAAPEQLLQEEGGFFDMVAHLNVKVLYAPRKTL